MGGVGGMNWRYDEVKLLQLINDPLKYPNQIHQPTLLMSLFFSGMFSDFSE